MNIVKACEGGVFQNPQLHIVVGVSSARSELRVCVLLQALPDVLIEKLSPGDDVEASLRRADLVIGSEKVVLKAVLLKKLVIIVGEYGLGGLITPGNLIEQYHSGFLGRLKGEKNEYFSYEQLFHEIEKSSCLSALILEHMSNRIEKETLNERLSQ